MNVLKKDSNDILFIKDLNYSIILLKINKNEDILIFKKQKYDKEIMISKYENQLLFGEQLSNFISTEINEEFKDIFIKNKEFIKNTIIYLITKYYSNSNFNLNIDYNEYDSLILMILVYNSVKIKLFNDN